MNRITYNGKNYDDTAAGTDMLLSASCYIANSIVADQLSADTLTAEVIDYDLQERLLAAGGMLLECGGRLLTCARSNVGMDIYQYAAPVWFYHNNTLIGKFYLESITRTGKYTYQLECISAVGLLTTDNHYGGIYTGQAMAEVVSDIIGGLVPYTIDSELGATEIYGWLPKATRRDNLRDVLFNVGGQIQKDVAGQLNIVPVDISPPYSVSVDEMYLGGSVTNGTPATQAVITEHNYAARATDEETNLYDGEALGDEITTPGGLTVTGSIIDFDEPMHDLSVEGAEILESGVNYAVLSSSAAATLTGKKYTHTTRSIVRNSTAKSNAPNVVSVPSCYLVNIRNSANVANRVIAYYGYAKTVDADLVLTNQKPGDYISFTDPYGDSRIGFIQSLDVTVSAILKARASIVCGYTPPAIEKQYLHYQFFFSNDVWIAPAAGTKIVRYVLIGGGPGGPSGVQGGSSELGKSWSRGPYTTTSSTGNRNIYYNGVGPGKGGQGGAGSAGASGANVYAGSTVVTPGQSYSIIIGAGGKGGVCSGETATPGTAGGASMFGSLSSDSGKPITNGYLEEITGETYAGAGESGASGGDGVSGALETYRDTFWDDTAYKNAYTIPDGVTYAGSTYAPGQAQGDSIYNTQSYGDVNSTSGKCYYEYMYGLGGGAAVGATGPSSTNSDGATGATPPARVAQTKAGYGGHGGHGGGGAGGCGAKGLSVQIISTKTPTIVAPTSSITDGGLGGTGGDGAPGAVFLYWYSNEP